VDELPEQSRARALTPSSSPAGTAGIFAQTAETNRQRGFAALSMDVIYNQPVLLPTGSWLAQAVAWSTFGLVPFGKQFVSGVAVGLFVPPPGGGPLISPQWTDGGR
jgi:hypothetical protein